MQRSSSADADSTIDLVSLKPSDILWDSAPIKFTVWEEGTFSRKLLRQQLAPDQPNKRIPPTSSITLTHRTCSIAFGNAHAVVYIILREIEFYARDRLRFWAVS